MRTSFLAPSESQTEHHRLRSPPGRDQYSMVAVCTPEPLLPFAAAAEGACNTGGVGTRPFALLVITMRPQTSTWTLSEATGWRHLWGRERLRNLHNSAASWRPPSTSVAGQRDLTRSRGRDGPYSTSPIVDPPKVNSTHMANQHPSHTVKGTKLPIASASSVTMSI